MRTEDKIKTREKLIEATLDVIAEVGFDKVTVRKIAARANVNIALISYYFESKEKAIFTAMDALGGEFQDCFEHLSDHAIPPDQRIQAFFRHYADIAYKHPYVMRSLLAITGKLQEHKMYSYMRTEGFEKFKNTVLEMHPVGDDNILNIRFFQAMCAIAFPTLLADDMEAMTGISYGAKQDRDAYIDILVTNFL